MALPLMWLEHRLAEQAVTVEQLMQIEGQQQAADQVSLGNSIGSLRFLAAMDWRKFVESLSLVEQTLRGYSPGEFGDLDVSSRDARRVVQAMQGVLGRLQRNGFRHARPVSPCRRTGRQTQPVCRVGGGRAGGPVGETGRRLERCSRSFGSRRIFFNRQGIASARSGCPGAHFGWPRNCGDRPNGIHYCFIWVRSDRSRLPWLP